MYSVSKDLAGRTRGSYTYDANGNTLTDPQGRSFTWDFENRLTQATNPGVGTTTFRYDPFGRRIQKSGPLGTTNYLYDGSGVSEELDTSGNVMARYTFGPRTDEPLSELRLGTTSYYAQDAVSTVTSLSNSDGTLANTYSYDAFGNLLASTGTMLNPYRYTGREFDPESGVYFYRARYYDQSAGHFVSEDPARFGSGGLDFYNYALNSPANFNDPTGLAACCQKNIDQGERELEKALNNAQIMGQGVFKKYKKCLLKPLPEVKCDPTDKGCGYHHPFSPSTITISPLGAAGRKGPCGPVASTLLHELVHLCYQSAFDTPDLTPLQQEQEAWQAECQMFGFGCVCAQDPKKCGY